MSTVPPDDVLRRLMAMSIREQIKDLEERHEDKSPEEIAETRALLDEFAEALEQDLTIEELRRRKMRHAGKPLLRLVS